MLRTIFGDILTERGLSPTPSEALSVASSTSTRNSQESDNASTPPTTISAVESITATDPEPTKEEEVEEDLTSRRRSVRSKVGVDTYSDTIKSGHAVHCRKGYRKEEEYVLAQAARSISGATLVNDNTSTPQKRRVSAKKGDAIFEVQSTPQSSDGTIGVRTRRSLGVRPTSSSSAALNAMTSLGKRSRDALDSAKGKLQSLGRAASLRSRRRSSEDEESPAKKRLRASTGKAIPVEAEEIAEPPAEPKKKPKIWLQHGLYVGQEREENFRQKSGKPKSSTSEAERKYMPLPMFTGARLLVKGRNFTLPFDILNPLPKVQAPKNWSNLSRNRFIGDAEKTWKKSDLDLNSKCNCTAEFGCGDDCLNRTMSYECNNNNCHLSAADCKNRPFAELKWRKYGKNVQRNPEKKESNMWGEGVEVMQTGDRGHGVRSMRAFKPHQIICEYNGEVITQEEADRRMNQDYKDQPHFYLMTFHRGLIIDATKGSICRFVNHSCAPNCTIEKWIVDGEPRMALFAGENGISSSEELTYDYKFDPFSRKNVQTCLCGAANCRGVLGPKTMADNKFKIAATKLLTGVKRGLKQVAGYQSDSSPRKRVALSQKGSPLKQSVSRNQAEPAVKPVSSVSLKMQAQSRQHRALKRATSTSTLKTKSGRSIKRTISVAEFKLPTASKNKKSHRHSLPAPRTKSTGRLSNLATSLKKTATKTASALVKNTAGTKEPSNLLEAKRLSMLAQQKAKAGNESSRTKLLNSRTSLDSTTYRSTKTSVVADSDDEDAMEWEVPESPSSVRQSSRAPKPSPKALENKPKSLSSKGRNSLITIKKRLSVSSRKASAKTTPVPSSAVTSPAQTPAGRIGKRVAKPSPKMREIQSVEFGGKLKKSLSRSSLR